MFDSTLTLLASTAIKSVRRRFPVPSSNTTKLVSVPSKTTITQLQTEVDTLEKYVQDELARKQQQEQNTLQEKVIQGVQQLETLANQINTLATQVEAEMLKFKEVAVEVNRCYHLMQKQSNPQFINANEPKLSKFRPLNIWEVHNLSIPTVIKCGTKFILTVKAFSLFNFERQVNAQTQTTATQRDINR